MIKRKIEVKKNILYHISKDMIPRKCDAEEGNCPLGGAHYRTMQEAQAAADEQMLKEERENNKKTNIFQKVFGISKKPKKKFSENGYKVDNITSEYADQYLKEHTELSSYSSSILERNSLRNFSDVELPKDDGRTKREILKKLAVIVDEQYIRDIEPNLEKYLDFDNDDIKENENYTEVTYEHNGLTIAKMDDGLNRIGWDYHHERKDKSFFTTTHKSNVFIVSKEDFDNTIAKPMNGVAQLGRYFNHKEETRNITNNEDCFTTKFQYKTKGILPFKSKIDNTEVARSLMKDYKFIQKNRKAPHTSAMLTAEGTIGFMNVKKFSQLKQYNKTFDVYCTFWGHKTDEYNDEHSRGIALNLATQKYGKTSGFMQVFLVPTEG